LKAGRKAAVANAHAGAASRSAFSHHDWAVRKLAYLLYMQRNNAFGRDTIAMLSAFNKSNIGQRFDNMVGQGQFQYGMRELVNGHVGAGLEDMGEGSVVGATYGAMFVTGGESVVAGRALLGSEATMFAGRTAVRGAVGSAVRKGMDFLRGFGKDGVSDEIKTVWNVATNGLRNEAPLTEEEKKLVLDFAKQLGMPEENIGFTEHASTSYYQNWDQLRVGTDVLPSQTSGLGTLTANSRVSLRGALAHEIYGHRAAALAGMTHSDPLLEEVQASIRAARYAPGLTSTERVTLLRDAIARLSNAGIKIRDVKEGLWISQDNGFALGLDK
jgi:hypothetical protein